MLIVDGLGRIHGCGAAIEKLFKASHGQLIGRPVSAFIAGLLPEGSSPAEIARQLAQLCTQDNWRKFTAVDAQGGAFPIEIHLSRRMTEGQTVFVFNMRRPESMACG